MVLTMNSSFLHFEGPMRELPSSNISIILQNRLTAKACYYNTSRAPKRSMLGTSSGLLMAPQHQNPFKWPSVSLLEKKDTTDGVPVMKALMPVDRSAPRSLVVEETQGLRIVESLEGKSLFLTGSTGFLAKVLVETILRTIPGVSKIYLLVRANNHEAATERLKNEVIYTDLFKSLQTRHGESYERFMLSKLIPVTGNVCETDLGLDEVSAAIMAEQVDVIINSAANTSFNQRYDVSINTNTRGPHHVMAFAKKCKNLKVFLHVSTAYVTSQRQGIMPEKLMGNGSYTTANGEAASDFLPSGLSIQNEINLALSSAGQAEGDENHRMRELGLQRARKFGFHNTYSFTKAMGEVLLNSTKGNIPLVIVRPTIIEGAIKDPLPGWIEGNRMVDPLMTFYGKGITSGFIGDPNTILDIVPVDMVVNAIVAITAKQIQRLQKRKLRTNLATMVYHIGSSVNNPVTLGFLANMFYKHCMANPLLDSNGILVHVNPFILYDSIKKFNIDVWRNLTTTRQQIPAGSSSSSSQITSTGPIVTHVANEHSSASRKLKLCRRLAVEIDTFAHLYEPYLFYYTRFDNNNVQSIIDSMSDEERRTFYFDTKSIDWEDYYLNVHSPGLRKHVVKDKN